MMNELEGVLLAVFMVLTLLFAGLSYHLYGAREEAVLALGVAIKANSSLVEAAKKQEVSCRIDDTTIGDAEADKKLLQARVDDITQQMANLKSGIKQASTNDMGTSPKGDINVKTNTPLDGTELLSDPLRLLLDASYCATEPTDCSIPTGQSVSKPL